MGTSRRGRRGRALVSRLASPSAGFVAGWVALSAGCALVSVQLGLIVSGTALIGLSLAAELGGEE